MGGRLEQSHLPLLIDRLETSLDVKLLGGSLGHLTNQARILLEMQLNYSLQSKGVTLLLKVLVRLLLDLLPMPLPHRLVMQVADQRHGSLEPIHLALGHLNYVPAPLLQRLIHRHKLLELLARVLVHLLRLQRTEHLQLPAIVLVLPPLDQLPHTPD